MDILYNFIMTERSHYEIDDNNRFAFSLGQASRYYGFLYIILGRYKEFSEESYSLFNKYMELSKLHGKLLGRQSHSNMEEMNRLTGESKGLTTLLHLEIESFYLFAKIFLDIISRFLFVFFGQSQGVRLKSHNNLTQYYEKYFEDKSLIIPPGFIKSIKLLKESVCDYRDEQISHELSLRRSKGTSWDSSGDAKISAGIFYPREGERGASTEVLPQLMDNINEYILQLMTLITDNRIKSKFKLIDD